MRGRAWRALGRQTPRVAVVALVASLAIVQACAPQGSRADSERLGSGHDTGAAEIQESESGFASEMAKVRVVILPHLTFAPLLIAEAEGYFAEQGLDVEFIKLASSASTVPLLLQGRVDVLPSPISPAFLHAMARGGGLRFVADKGYLAADSCDQMVIVTRPDHLHSSSAPGGTSMRRLSASRYTFLWYLIERGLESAGVSPATVEVLTLPPAAEIDALHDGSIDAAFMSDPWLTMFRDRTGGEVWIRLEEVLPDYQISLITYGSRLLDEEPELGRRFMVAYLKGVRRLNEGKTTRNVEILAETTGTDAELLRRSCWPAFRDDGRINMQSLIEFQEWAVDQGLLDEVVGEESFWDSSFIDNANDFLAAVAKEGELTGK